MNESICTSKKYQIGKITYQVVSSASENARETIDIKINKLIKKSVLSSEKQLFFNENT